MASFTVQADVHIGAYNGHPVRWIGRGPFKVPDAEAYHVVFLIPKVIGFAWVFAPDAAFMEVERQKIGATFPGGVNALPDVPA